MAVFYQLWIQYKSQALAQVKYLTVGTVILKSIMKMNENPLLMMFLTTMVDKKRKMSTLRDTCNLYFSALLSEIPATTFSTKLSLMGDKLIVFTNCFQPPPLRSYRLLTCSIKAVLLWEVSWGGWETSCDYTASLIPQPLLLSVYNLIGWGDGKISLRGLNFLFSVRIFHAWLGALSWLLAFCLGSFTKESLLTVTQDWCAYKP